MRPCTPDALPVMGRVPGTEGAYLSCGHNCWGILWAPVCGLAMAELVATGAARVVDLTPFAPERYLRVMAPLPAPLPSPGATTPHHAHYAAEASRVGEESGESGNEEEAGGRGRRKGQEKIGEQW